MDVKWKRASNYTHDCLSNFNPILECQLASSFSGALYDLTIIKDERGFTPIHGSMHMEPRKTCKEAKADAIAWFTEHSN